MRFKMARTGAAVLAAIYLSMFTVVSGQSLVDVSPRSIVTTLGQNASMICRVGHPIKSCRVEIQKETYILDDKERSSSGNMVYFGGGFDRGECGVMIRRVEESMNGAIKCYVPPTTGQRELSGVAELVIAKAPDGPVLQVNPGTQSPNVFRVGDTFLARCVAEHGRPAAVIKWFIVGYNNVREPLLDGLHTIQKQDEPNSDLVTTSQNLTRRLSADDNGKQILCVVEHQALNSPRIAARQLEVLYAPEPREDPILIFGIHLGSTGLVNVTIRSNPEPQLEWHVNGDRIVQGSVDPTGRIEALTPTLLGNGYYNATLRINSIIKEDTEVLYELRARNPVNLQIYRVRISTLEEPMSLALDAGSIVGIVIAVLVLLIAIVIVVFAKATNRWCFGGNSRRSEIPDAVDSETPFPPHHQDQDVGIKGTNNPTHNARDRNEEKTARPKSSGESSDTESAVGGPKTATATATTEKRRRIELPEFARSLPAQLRAVLPGRNKDRVAQADVEIDTKATNEDDKTEGEKKSIVYAELSLNQGGEPQAKPNPESTEYAEIQYAEKETAKKEEK